MKYLLILLLIAGSVKGQVEYVQWRIPTEKLMKMRLEWSPISNGVDTVVVILTDTCSRYGDSIRIIDKNIQIWQRRIRANDPEFNIVLQQTINALQGKRKDFMDKLNKCKP